MLNVKKALTKVLERVNLDYYYPVGTIYQTTSSTFDPNTSWGGTWSLITGKMLVGSGDSAIGAIGATGGERVHTLTANESGIKSHNHGTGTFQTLAWTGSSGTGIVSLTSSLVNKADPGTGAKFGTYYFKITTEDKSANATNAHNNMPPYQVVNIWKRTA